MFENILVAVDDSEMARWALETAGRLAHRLGSRVALVQVIDVTKGFSPEFEFAREEILARQEKAATDVLTDAQAHLPPEVASERMLLAGDPATEILNAASRWGADLIVMGTHGRGRIVKLVLGSVADVVIRNAPCPVVTVGSQPRPILTSVPAVDVSRSFAPQN